MDKYAVFEGLIKTAIIDCGVKDLTELPENIQRIVKLLDAVIEATTPIQLYVALHALTLHDCHYIICPLIDEIRSVITLDDEFDRLINALIKHDYADGLRYILDHKCKLDISDSSYKLVDCIKHNALKCMPIIVDKSSESYIISAINSSIVAQPPIILSLEMYKLLKPYFTNAACYTDDFIYYIYGYDCDLILKYLIDSGRHIPLRSHFDYAIQCDSVKIVQLLHPNHFQFVNHHDIHGDFDRGDLEIATSIRGHKVAMYIISTNYQIDVNDMDEIIRQDSCDLLSFLLQMRPKIIRELLSHGDAWDFLGMCIPLTWFRNDNKLIFKRLKILEKYGAPYENSQILSRAIRYGNRELVEYLLKNKKIKFCKCTNTKLNAYVFCENCHYNKLSYITTLAKSNAANMIDILNKYI